MRWVTYRSGQKPARVGLLVGAAVLGSKSDVSLSDLLTLGPAAMRGVGEEILAEPFEVVALTDVELQLPFRPLTIRDGAGFLQHLRNNARVLGNDLDPRFQQYPPFYFGNVASSVGPDAAIRIPPDSERLDFELEIGAVIGTAGSDIPVAAANDHIAGYLIFCDWSARDLQIAERGLFGQMKGKDFANSFGPALVTPDEIEPYRSEKGFKLGLSAFLNGEQISEGNWADVEWDFPDMISFASRGVALQPGEVIGSGTVPSGCLFESFSHDPDTFRGWLKPGDELTLRVEQLGELRHTVLPSRVAQRLSSGY